MLKRKILAAVLPVVAAGTVVGSGFSAWHFGETQTQASNVAVGIEVSEVSNGVGSFKILLNGQSDLEYRDQDIRVYLDQSSGSEENRKDITRGISFDYGNSTSEQWNDLNSIVFTYTIDKTSYENLAAANMSLKFSFGVIFNETFLKWVTPKGLTETQDAVSYAWSSVSLKTTDKKSFTGGENSSVSLSGGQYTFSWTITTSTENDVNEMLQYVKKPNMYEDATPDNLDDDGGNVYYTDLVDDMDSLIGNDVITFTASAKLVED